jgi:hypothetical protein
MDGAVPDQRLSNRCSDRGRDDSHIAVVVCSREALLRERDVPLDCLRGGCHFTRGSFVEGVLARRAFARASSAWCG